MTTETKNGKPITSTELPDYPTKEVTAAQYMRAVKSVLNNTDFTDEVHFAVWGVFSKMMGRKGLPAIFFRDDAVNSETAPMLRTALRNGWYGVWKAHYMGVDCVNTQVSLMVLDVAQGTLN